VTVELTDEQLAAAQAFVHASESAAGDAMRQLVETLIAGGERPAFAIRLAGAALLIDRFGPGVLEEMGVPQRTAYETRGRLAVATRKAAEAPRPVGTPGPSLAARWAETRRIAAVMANEPRLGPEGGRTERTAG
jgi:hypothetical protein